ncbi:MAG TPA: hypothetical protein VJ821_03705 [Anaerolineales bacterium]|nr:hypothetical protein [Anaerolineales bacterium]
MKTFRLVPRKPSLDLSIPGPTRSIPLAGDDRDRQPGAPCLLCPLLGPHRNGLLYS